MSNQHIYDDIDTLVQTLRADGLTDAADQIHFLLHKVAWTTSSELFEELRDRFRNLLESSPPPPPAVAIRLKRFIYATDAP